MRRGLPTGLTLAEVPPEPKYWSSRLHSIVFPILRRAMTASRSWRSFVERADVIFARVRPQRLRLRDRSARGTGRSEDRQRFAGVPLDTDRDEHRRRRNGSPRPHQRVRAMDDEQRRPDRRFARFIRCGGLGSSGQYRAVVLPAFASGVTAEHWRSSRASPPLASGLRSGCGRASSGGYSADGAVRARARGWHGGWCFRWLAKELSPSMIRTASPETTRKPS